MAASLVIEYERGETRGATHRHNGYWAGDFSGREPERPRGVGTAPGPGMSAGTGELGRAAGPSAPHRINA